ncbi:MAG TPA: nicotinate-nicotinamide nucleotide adenylyltransferase [Deltaproteobacteria bacterium]|nr:nicotinate-nicotinamide nucleotide adenylyltransferase [Deltaproteobacteria bacterium]
MRIAIYGGSFNPPHIGHLMVSAWLRWTDQVDEVWLLPAFSHPFAKELAPFAERVSLCEAATSALDGVSVCAIEAHLPVPSYSIDTLTALAGRHPEHRFRFVLGADALAEVDRWKEWDRLQARFPPIPVGRQGYPTPPGAIDFPGISSTEIRRRAWQQRPIAHLVPGVICPRVEALYGPPPGSEP